MPLKPLKTKEDRWDLRAPTCDGIKVIDSWFPKRKAFENGEDVNEKLMALLQEYNGLKEAGARYGQRGLSIETYEVYAQIPSFKAAAALLIGHKVCKPRWKEGDTVMLMTTKHKEGTAQITPYVVHEHIGWTIDTGCTIQKGEAVANEAVMCRKFLNGTTQEFEIHREDQFMPVVEIDAFKTKRKHAKQVVKLMKSLNMHGGYLHYDGQVYRF